MQNLAQNDKFKVAFDDGGIVLYEPNSDTDYHTCRYVAANAQNIYSSTGATKEVLQKICEHAVKLCNTQDIPTLKTDIGLLMNNILSRLTYPVDEDCALRMAAIFYLLPDEEPNECHDIILRKKIEMAKSNPKLYDFFLSRGLLNTPAYKELLDCLNDRDYLSRRAQTLSTLLPLSVKE